MGPARRRGRDRAAAPLAAAWIWSIVAAIALAIAAGIAGFSLYAVFRLHVTLPIWDTWATVIDAKLVDAGTYGWAELSRQHNEHRLLFPRLLFLADRAWFAMSDLDLLAEGFALQAVTASVLIRLGWIHCADRRLRMILAAFVVAVLFSLDQEQNFTNGFQVQFVGVFTVAVLGAVAYAAGLDRLGTGTLAGAARPGGWHRLALAGIACLVATYTMANGVLLGFALAAVAVLARASWRVVLATLAFAAALAAAFFHGYELGPDSGSGARLLADPLAYPAFVLAYLGSPATTDPRLAQLVGAVGLAGAAVAAVRLATGRRRAVPVVALMAVMAFVAASAAATAFGRAQYGTADALETRYVTPAAVFWCALVALWFGDLPRDARALGPVGRAGLAGLAAVMVWLVANAAVQQAREWPLLVERTSAIRQFRDSLWSGLYDPDASSYENNADTDIRPLIPYLATKRLSLFAAPQPWTRGRPVTALGPAAPESACAGTVAARSDPRLGPDGVRLAGTAWDRDGDRSVRRILAVGPDGEVSGFGSPDKPVGQPHGWTGYATAAPGQTVAAYARLDDGRICRIGAAGVAAS